VHDPPRLVIFDCDGVLVDSERIAVSIDLEVLAYFGIRMSESEVVERFVGRSESVMRQAVEEQLGRSLPDDWDDRFRHWYDDAYESELAPVEGILDALDRIQSRCLTCVASSSEPDSLRHKLTLTGLLGRFNGSVFSAAEVMNGKPAPDVFLYAADRMGVAPARCAVVEDSPYGVQAARAAGMEAFGYTGGVTNANALAGGGATVFADMRELPRLMRMTK
jgi:HAD superfamily hydrolase (TIGR01509 family)